MRLTPEARAAIERALDYRFLRAERLELALTHRSSNPDGINNETLEFLGDAVLALAMSDLLMTHFPAAREGELSKIRAALVNAEVLARKARELDLGRWLQVGKGEERSGGRAKESILAAAYEALLGAVYLDSGFEPTRGIVAGHFTADVAAHATVGFQDHKTRLQELTQRLFRETPLYVLVAERGPDHDKIFDLELRIGGRVYGAGSGRSKKHAEQAAAEAALVVLTQEHPEGQE
jgi:ribonuclease III